MKWRAYFCWSRTKLSERKSSTSRSRWSGRTSISFWKISRARSPCSPTLLTNRQNVTTVDCSTECPRLFSAKCFFLRPQLSTMIWMRWLLSKIASSSIHTTSRTTVRIKTQMWTKSDKKPQACPRPNPKNYNANKNNWLISSCRPSISLSRPLPCSRSIITKSGSSWWAETMIS